MYFVKKKPKANESYHCYFQMLHELIYNSFNCSKEIYNNLSKLVPYKIKLIKKL